MQIKTLALAALSATVAVAGPHQRRQQHHHFRGTGHSGHARPTGGPFPAGNATDVNPTGTRGRLSSTVLPTFGNAASSTVDADGTSICTSTSTATATSVQYVTVTASGSSKSEPSLQSTASVSAGQFYGSRTWGGNPSGASSAAPWGSSAAASGGASTTFMTQPSASKTAGSAPSSTPSSGSSSGNSTGGSAPGVSGSKRGVGFNDASKVAVFGSSVSWAYNWAQSESGSLGNVEYVPMCWGLNSVGSFSAGNAKSVLSFNEPDLSTQSNIDPVTAATKHKQVFSSLKGKVNIGSPAITNGDSQGPNYMGIPWLNQFFTSCGSDCPVDFVAFHWYAGANNIAYFKQHVNDVIAAAAAHGINKVWLTEFAPDSGSDSDKATFFQQAVQFLESTPQVERYAAFMASDGTLLSGSSLNAEGKAYAG